MYEKKLYVFLIPCNKDTAHTISGRDRRCMRQREPTTNFRQQQKLTGYTYIGYTTIKIVRDEYQFEGGE